MTGVQTCALPICYSGAELARLAPELLSFDPNGPSREGKITGYYVQGEFLQYFPIIQTLGTQTELTQSSTLGSVSLHSQALLTAFVQNDDFRRITFKLPELLEMVFDEALYARSTSASNTQFVNLLEHLIRHQTGVAGSYAADDMLDRFTSDLQKIAQDGGFTLTNAQIGRASCRGRV